MIVDVLVCKLFESFLKRYVYKSELQKDLNVRAFL